MARQHSGVTVVERVYFGIIALAALFVTYGGFLFPKELDSSFTWALLPPLHARFVGALYLFGGVYMIGCALGRYRSQITPGPPAVIIFTTLLLAVTLLNLEAFDFDLVPVWVWTVSYIVYPFLGLLLIAWTYRRTDVEPSGPPLPNWVRTFLLVEAGIFAVAGLLLLFAREVMVDAWPWPISNGLAQFYGGPFLAIAYCCWRYSTRSRWTEIMPIAPAMLAFTVATVVVSVIHRSLFSASDASTWVWFIVFGASALVFARVTAGVVTARA